MNHLRSISRAILALGALSVFPVCGLAEQSAGGQGSGLHFAVALPASLPSDSVTGRVFLFVARSGDVEPRFQTQNVSIFGVDIHGSKAGDAAVIDASVPGFPEHTLGDLPAGDYWVQALLNVYTEFHRSDGHVIWAHMDQWDGQNFKMSPGNIFSEPQKVHLDPHATAEERIVLSKINPPYDPPVDTDWVKHVKIESKLLTQFWGRPMYIGATVLLPKGFDSNPGAHYPTIYLQGHFSLGAPFSFDPSPEKPGGKTWAELRKAWIASHPREWAKGHLNMPEPPQNARPNAQNDGALPCVEGGHAFYESWVSDDFPRMIAVTFQHPTPFFDDSYAINSANCGPYGDAIMKELIPYLESHFRSIPKPYARVLAGGSTGGWETLALQIYHPEFFGGAWSFYPDPVDFHRYYGVDLYNDENAFANRSGRTFAGVADMLKGFGQVGTVTGMEDGPLQWWDYTPPGPDGTPLPVWDLSTGKIDHAVVKFMIEHNYDLRDYLERNWTRIGPQLVQKLHVFVGDDDDGYENLAVYLFEDYLENTQNPYYDGSFTYGRPLKGHGWMPITSAELVRTMAKFIADHAPPDAPTRDWLESNRVPAVDHPNRVGN